MATLIHDNWPELKKAWDAYGHEKKFEELTAIKYNSFYCVVAWPEEDDTFGIADLTFNGKEWEFNNDCCGTGITVKQWNSVRLDLYLETFTMKEEE